MRPNNAYIASSHVDAIAQPRLSAVVRGLDELLDENPAIGEDHALRADVVGIGGDLDVLQPAVRHIAQDHAERQGGVAAAALPRHDRVSRCGQARGRKLVRAVLPAKADRSAEFAIPHPAAISG